MVKLGKGINGTVNLDVDTLTKHGFIVGTTGSGKTTTIKTIVQRATNKHIPSVLFDAKGDLIDLLSNNKGNLYTFKGSYGKEISVSINDMEIDLVSNVLELNNTQSSILATCFLISKDIGYRIVTLEDLEYIFNYVTNNSEVLSIKYGRISNTSINTIRRKLNELKLYGLSELFNYTSISKDDLIRSKTVNIIDSVELIKHPKVYASVVLSILEQFYNNLNEHNGLRCLVVIDEAHTLFNKSNKAMSEKIEQITKLIRSKGIGIIFITQNIDDIPKNIVSMLNTRIIQKTLITTTNQFAQARALTRSFNIDGLDINEKVDLLNNLEQGQALIQYEQNKVINSEIIKVDYVEIPNISDERLQYFKKYDESHKYKEPFTSDLRGVNCIVDTNTHNEHNSSIIDTLKSVLLPIILVFISFLILFMI